MNKPETRIQQRNRAAIMSAGLEVFSQFGLRGSTLDQIAEAAGLSKPNLLYYFRSKDAIYTALLEKLLETWLDPLLKLDPQGDPIQEVLGYVRRKLTMSKEYPRESRLFANEILLGAPHIAEHLSKDLRALVTEKAVVIREWEAAGKIAPVDPYHLIFSIWSTTQHYADFDVQVRAVLGGIDPFDDAMKYLDTLFRRMLTPPKA
ncbi:TetR family transcriptional regulator C-terminal domain-containing protein [Yoonia sp. I 8.24]|uniref:TetR family transcriptional regulator C-terminal domain-containing protein n=1 Tax=Yoonia sp. I 8.24 TaxID=1537229 RepID=UPI001EDE7EC5|nr:TetR family transcriptional regulator C-terminal domain-containing protein [Yoonia sp. I 8.24]MCG3269055.1 TetR family transcriptional regulator C-terminal domain-containing protein [Yoonia sp. I 8.24]